MTSPRVAVVFNAVARHARGAPRRDELEGALERRGLDVRWLETTPEDPGTKMLSRAIDDGVDMVMVSGGDGTVMACATALANTDIPLALLPAGTGNLLANNFQIPRDQARAMEVALNGGTKKIDLGRTQHGCFVIMAGMGFDAAMLRDANPRLKSRLGAVAYVFSGIKQLRAPVSRLDICVDRRQQESTEAHMVLIGNLGRLQGGIAVFPDADPEDGVLSVATVTAGTIRAWLQIAWRVLAGRSGDDARVHTFSARTLEIEATPALPVELDGDVFGEVSELSVEVLPGALTLRVPRV
jgi:YegS/Rv2252/BmrU family lipid kinase